MDSCSSSSTPAMMRRPDNIPLPDNKKLRLDTSAKVNSSGVEIGTATSTSAPQAHSQASAFDSLPVVILPQIAAFTPASSLSGASRSTLSAIRALHYKMNMRRSGLIPNLDGHMGLQASGALSTGRVVTRITVDVVGQEDQVSTVEVCRRHDAVVGVGGKQPARWETAAMYRARHVAIHYLSYRINTTNDTIISKCVLRALSVHGYP